MADKASEPKEKTKSKVEKETSTKTSGGIEIKDKVQVDFEPEFNTSKDKLKNEENDKLDPDDNGLDETLAFILDYDMELDEEVESIIKEFYEEINQLDEALTIGQRVKKRQVMRRYRSRIQISRKRSLRRRATAGTLQKRARRSAISMVKKKYANKRPLNTLSYSERGRLERIVKSRKGAVARSTRRLVRVKRQQERQRLGGRRK